MDDDELCPICIEPFDDDMTFYPCVCNYRVCMFCVRRIRTEFDGRCPGCRKPYNEQAFRFEKVDTAELERKKLKKIEQQRKGKDNQFNRSSSNPSSIGSKQQSSFYPLSNRGRQTSQPSTTGTSSNSTSNIQKPKLQHQQSAPSLATPSATTGTSSTIAGSGKQIGPLTQLDRTSSAPNQSSQPIPGILKSRLPYANVRATNPDLVYLTGLAPNIAKESVLQKNDYFGQYGQILSIAIQSPTNPSSKEGASAQILYSHPDEALQAIQTVDGFVLEGYKINARLAKSKYCKSFLAGQPCRDTKCMDLHRIVNSDSESQTG